MKKIVLFFILLGIPVLAICQVTVINLLNSVNWEEGEEGLLKEYPNDIEKKDEVYLRGLLYKSYFKEVVIGDKSTRGAILLDSIDNNYIREFSIRYEDKSGRNCYKYIKSEIEKEIGLPDESNEGGINLSIWFKENSYIKVSSFFDSSCTVTIKPINSIRPVFRKARFGDSFQKIRSLEQKENLSDRNDFYIFEDYLLGSKCNVTYLFGYGKFLQGSYDLLNEYSNKNDYIELYNTLKGSLSSKYGVPNNSNVVWIDKLFKDNRDDYGIAISLGHLKYTTEWHTSDCRIEMELSGNNGEISLSITYRDLELFFLLHKYMVKGEIDDKL